MLVTPPGLTPWHPGTNGKGFIINDQPYTWAVEHIDGLPSHEEAFYHVSRPHHNTGVGADQEDEMTLSSFYISPEGEIAVYGFVGTDMEVVARKAMSHDPRLKWSRKDAFDVYNQGWAFESAAKIPPIPDFDYVGTHLSPDSGAQVRDLVNKGWQPGDEGKGMVYDGQLYTWATQDDDGWPHHSDVFSILVPGENYGNAPTALPVYYIGPDGEFDAHDEQSAQIAMQQDPRLRPMEAEGFLSSVHVADEGGGGEAPGVAETGAYLGYPFWGIWGMASTRWQKHHRKRKKRKKKRKKKADFWEDQRKQDFPEDFHEDPMFGEMGTTKPIQYSDADIRQLVEHTIQKGGVPLGEQGKAIQFDGGQTLEWVTDLHGGPHHDDVLTAFRVYEPTGTFYVIDRDGSWESHTDFELDPDDWHFASGEPNEAGHVLNWEHGMEGKGLLLADGTLHTWDADEYEYHNDYASEHLGLDIGWSGTAAGMKYLYITPHGKINTIWGDLSTQDEERIREADPRLYVDIDEGGAAPWQFGAAAE